MNARLALIALLPAMLVACNQDFGRPDQTPQEGEDRAIVQPREQSDVQPPAQPGDAAEQAGFQLRLEGGHLVDGSGAALYALEDNADGSKCDAACEQVWPPVMSDAAGPSAAPELQQDAVSTVTVEQGGNQVTYHGHPLYRYAGDLGARTTTGHDVQDQWGRWWLVGVDGQPADAGGTQPDTD